MFLFSILVKTNKHEIVSIPKVTPENTENQLQTLDILKKHI